MALQAQLALVAMIAACGALGAVARFWLSGVVARRLGELFPWGTFAVNVSGSAAIGLVAGLILAPDRDAASSPLWLALVVGVLGSYTTVSSFSLQTLALARSGEPRRALLNVGASVAACLLAAASGFAVAAALSGRPL